MRYRYHIERVSPDIDEWQITKQESSTNGDDWGDVTVMLETYSTRDEALDVALAFEDAVVTYDEEETE